jgi:hypothetical protein
MDGPRLTEERLRNHLDSNQVMRERMCLALLPLLGPYTREQSRRPKGGPDGGRDIEAVYQGTVPVWGAVGFRNGGGSDDNARNAAESKFNEDLKRATDENPSLAGFVFFTNVDLTPKRVEQLKQQAQLHNIQIVEVYDLERLRHILDSPEGLIARLQYLDIPMSATEQAALVSKFGSQLQNAVTARFDRVERTLAQMERFLAFQKPLLRIDVYCDLSVPSVSDSLGDEAILVCLEGLHDLSKVSNFLCTNLSKHKHSGNLLVFQMHSWNSDSLGKVVSLIPCLGSQTHISVFGEYSLTTGGSRVRIVDLTIVGVEIICTDNLRSKLKSVAIDLNGFELFKGPVEAVNEALAKQWPTAAIPFEIATKQWRSVVKRRERNLLFEPLEPSPRFKPLMRV